MFPLPHGVPENFWRKIPNETLGRGAKKHLTSGFFLDAIVSIMGVSFPEKKGFPVGTGGEAWGKINIIIHVYGGDGLQTDVCECTVQ